MHRIAALLVLLVFGLAQAAAAECPMASGASDSVRNAAVAHAHHPTHQHSGGHSQAPAHGQVPCGLAMSCGTAVAVSATDVVGQPPIRLARAPRRLPHLYASPVLNTDSPPPRA